MLPTSFVLGPSSPAGSTSALQSSSLLVLGSFSRCFGPSSASFTLWFYVGVGFGYCFFVSSECVTNPAPVSPPKLDRHGFDVVDFIWPGDPDDVSQTVADEGVYSLQVMSLVALQASDPDTNMVLTLELKILNLVLSEMCLLLQIPFQHVESCSCVSYSGLYSLLCPTVYELTPPKYVNLLTSSGVWSLTVMGFMLLLMVCMSFVSDTHCSWDLSCTCWCNIYEGQKIFCQETLLPRLHKTFTVLLLWIQPVMIKGVENANFVAYIYMYIFCFSNESSDLRLIGRLTSAQLREVRLRGRPDRCYHDWLVGGLNPDKLQPPQPSSHRQSLPVSQQSHQVASPTHQRYFHPLALLPPPYPNQGGSHLRICADVSYKETRMLWQVQRRS